MKKNSTLKPAVFACLLVWLVIQPTAAQDVHFIQFQGAVLNLNPALAGASECDQCFTAQFQRKRQNVPVDYRTFSGTYDRKFRTSSNTGWFGGGLILNYDVAGDSRLNTTHLGLMGTYTRKLNRRNFLTFGLQYAGTQRAFDLGDLEFDDQWGAYNIKDDILTLNSTGETFSDLTVRFGGLSSGLNWAYAHPRSRLRFNAGIGGFHLDRPNKSFKNDVNVQHQRRITYYGFGTIPVAGKFDLILQALRQIQGPHEEIAFGAYLRGDLNTRPTHETALQVGALFRAKDAIIPAVGIIWKQWEAGFAYDINISDFRQATSGQGGPEAYVKYCIKPAPALRPCPLCPKRM